MGRGDAAFKLDTVAFGHIFSFEDCLQGFKVGECLGKHPVVVGVGPSQGLFQVIVTSPFALRFRDNFVGQHAHNLRCHT
jgi:hypothetical protein